MNGIKAWCLQEYGGGKEDIVFARNELHAILWAEELGWKNPQKAKAERAAYADAFRSDPLGLVKAKLEYGWQLDCYGEGCQKKITKTDAYSIIIDYTYCEDCTAQENRLTVEERFLEILEKDEQDKLKEY